MAVMQTIKYILIITLTFLTMGQLVARTRVLSDYQVRNMAETLVAKINERGDWLVVSAEGAFFNGRKVLFSYQIAEDSSLEAKLNNAGDWMVVSSKGGYVNGAQVVPETSIANNSVVSADINEKGEWIIASSRGAFKGLKAQ